jgi:two-component system, oxyanion-binding sensor
MTPFRTGYLPLTDAAALIIAAAKGFDRAQGVTIDLVRETSWASLRDNLVVGNLEAAHCLAPLAVATHLGLGHIGFPLRLAQVLTLNGNAITVSPKLARDLGDPLAPLAERMRLFADLVERRRKNGRRLVLATVFRYSCHTLLLRRFIEQGGGDFSADIDLVVLPPSLMVEGLAQGVIDGFSVGSPWNAAAVARANGTIIAIGHDILPDFVEKLLVVPASLPAAQQQALPAFTAAIRAATHWLTLPDNWIEASRILCAPDHLACDPDLILGSLSGIMPLGAGRTLQEPNYLRFLSAADAATCFTLAGRLADEMHASGMLERQDQHRPAILDFFSAVP